MNDPEQEIANIYQQALLESVHFSFKTTNSNIEKGGIRLNQEQALDLPYVSARTLFADGIYLPTDYQANAGKTASVFKVVKAAFLNEPTEELDAQTLQDIDQVKMLLPALKTQNLIAGAQYIDVRMRQLLIPATKGEYLSVSPLTAAGLCHVINQEVDQVKAQVDLAGKEGSLRKVKTALLGIGGSNPQNVGSLVRAMQRPMLVDAPRNEKSRKFALSLFYKGFNYQLNVTYLSLKLYQSLLQVQLLATEQAVDAGKYPAIVKAPLTTMPKRKQEDQYLNDFISDILRQGLEHFELLKFHIDALPTLEKIPRTIFWSHPKVNLVVKGLIDQELQSTDEWKQAFAEDLSKKLINYKYWPDQLNTNESIKMLSLDDNAKIYLIRKIIGLLP